MKLCTGCGMTKPLNEYHRHKYSKDGHKSRCKPCNVSAALGYVKANPEKTAAYQAEWSKGNLEKRNANVKAWVARNPKKARVTARVRTKRYQASEKGRVALEANRPAIRLSKSKYKVKRRSAEQAATPAWADSDQMKLYYIYADALGMHVDHIVPVVSDLVCGLHWEGNFQLLSPIENIVKGNRHWPDMP